MARPRGPRFKLSRHLGVNVTGHPNALQRGVKEHRNLSEHGKQLLEKQKLKTYYGVLEKQFRRYVDQAIKSKGNPGEILVQNLECRLDNIVYRLGFASTLRQARQMVGHGHILVNEKKVDRPSYAVQLEDIISLKEKSRSTEMFRDNFFNQEVTLSYLEKNLESFSGRLIKVPDRGEVPVEVIDSRIIEFYSKF